VKWTELNIEAFDRAFRKTQWGKNRFSENLCFFVPGGKIKTMKNYGKFWGVTEIFRTYGSGVKTDRDELVIDFDKESLTKKIKKAFAGSYDENFAKNYHIENSSSYKFKDKLKEQTFEDENITEIIYRPFDRRQIYYKVGFTSRPAFEVMKHLLKGENIGLVFPRICKNAMFDYGMVANKLVDVALGGKNTGSETYIAPLYLYQNFSIVTDKITDIHIIGDQTYVAPLYLHNGNTDKSEKDLFINGNGEQKIANFTPEFTRFISSLYPNRPSAKEILGYIYAIMYCPSYRQTYPEFLKIDFPRIPFAENYEIFKAISELGTELIGHHLMKKTYPESRITFPEKGSDMIENIRFYADKTAGIGNLHINSEQYFGEVPIASWEFHIGGYQVLDKWLKSRKDRMLSYQEKEAFRQIVGILNATDEYMNKIDNLWNEFQEDEL